MRSGTEKIAGSVPAVASNIKSTKISEKSVATVTTNHRKAHIERLPKRRRVGLLIPYIRHVSGSGLSRDELIVTGRFCN